MVPRGGGRRRFERQGRGSGREPHRDHVAPRPGLALGVLPAEQERPAAPVGALGRRSSASRARSELGRGDSLLLLVSPCKPGRRWRSDLVARPLGREAVAFGTGRGKRWSGARMFRARSGTRWSGARMFRSGNGRRWSGARMFRAGSGRRWSGARMFRAGSGRRWSGARMFRTGSGAFRGLHGLRRRANGPARGQRPLI
jgi:hypothetical protein